MLSLVGGATVLGYAPGPGTGNHDPYNPTDATPDCVPSANFLTTAIGTGTGQNPPQTTTDCNTTGPTIHWISDTVSGTATDNAWGQGDKSDCFLAKTGGVAGACSTMVFGIGANKTDLQYHGIGLANATVADGTTHSFLYSGIKRLLASGIASSNANYAVEINQDLAAYKPADPICADLATSGGTGGCNMWRTPGDLLLMTDWGGANSSCSSTTPDICGYVWIDFSGPNASPAGSTCFNAKAAPCWGLLPGGSADLFANQDKAAGSIDSGTSTFTEIGVDLTASGLVAPGACTTFNDVWAHSRSSSSFTAELKDFIFGHVSISTCSTTSTTLQQVDSGGNAIGSPSKTLTLHLDPADDPLYVEDIATVSGGATSGSVDFRYYGGATAAADCAADTAGSGGTDISTNGVGSTGSARSDKVSFSTPGVWYFKAFFLGDGLSPSASACDEVLTLDQNTSTSTALHETDANGADVSPGNNSNNLTIKVGGYVTDVATVVPSASVGSVSFRIYGGATAATDCAADTTGSGGSDGGANKTVSGGTATSDTKQFNSVGDFYWKAFFSGTSPYNNSASACDEVVHVQKVDTAIATGPWYYPNDMATITNPNGGGNPTGSVKFRLFDTSANCNAASPSDTVGTGGLLYREIVSSLPASAPFTVNTSNTSVKVSKTTTVWWLVNFTSTNAAQNGSNSVCVENINATLTNDGTP